VGCDTLTNTFFAYNSSNDDWKYGYPVPPAIGFRLLEGPIVPSPGDVATVDGVRRQGYKNLGMYSFAKYINGTDPDFADEAYWYQLGLDAKNNGDPYVYNGHPVRYHCSGDPVTGLGDLDQDADDRRAMASYGPFDFRPGDTQQVTIKFAAAQGTNYLNSITQVRDILNFERIPTPVDEPSNDEILPTTYLLAQN